MRQPRCAIYTRKSTEEGLEQDFNSLDAQREACAAFIQSQKQEGWTAIPKTYDDGGYSGGSMERPALKQLLADIEAKRVDVIVVYKVDRLTRSLSDFAKLVEIFDRCGVSFVSVTQQFNTTTSMGRLTLNILLSFAQFERELIGERVRDKVAASKKKGMWMGGTVPLGYDVKNRKLVVNKAEAKTVVEIYRRYLKLKSVPALREDLDASGIRSKRRIRADGSEYGHQKLSQGALYLMLQNRTYRGEATHKGQIYQGEHEPIVDEALWDNVQMLLAQNRIARASGNNTQEPSLLTGLVFDEQGERLTPTWTSKKGARYRYYVSTSLVTGKKISASQRRIPAGNLEAVVLERLRHLLTDKSELISTADQLDLQHSRQELLERGSIVASQLTLAEKKRALITALLRRVVVQSHDIKLEVSLEQLTTMLSAKTVNPPNLDAAETAQGGHTLTLSAPAQFQRVAREIKLMVNRSEDAADPNIALLRVIAKGYDLHARLEADDDLSVRDLATADNISSSYVYSLLRLRWLSPAIVATIVNGRQPKDLTAKKLMRLSARLPAEWQEQLLLLGFRQG
jgi:DNA invertase Pin-like site-specific DNA recombinase